MGRRKGDTLSRKTGSCQYRPVCWVSAEGTTERDYFHMSVFGDSRVAVKFSKDIHPSRRDPQSVRKRMEKTMRSERFRKEDTAWLVVDVDDWDEGALGELARWAEEDPRHHLAVSNPKFELFLVMHFERAAGCTTPERVDAALSRHLPSYDKRLRPTQFSLDQVREAVRSARAKRASCRAALPEAGMTDAYRLVELLLDLGEG